MQLLAKLKRILYMEFRATLDFRKFKVVFGRIFGPRMTKVTLNILHPFKYPGLRVISSE